MDRKQFEGELITLKTKEFFRLDRNNDGGGAYRMMIMVMSRASITQLSISVERREHPKSYQSVHRGIKWRS